MDIKKYADFLQTEYLFQLALYEQKGHLTKNESLRLTALARKIFMYKIFYGQISFFEYSELEKAGLI